MSPHPESDSQPYEYLGSLLNKAKDQQEEVEGKIIATAKHIAYLETEIKARKDKKADTSTFIKSHEMHQQILEGLYMEKAKIEANILEIQKQMAKKPYRP